MKHSIVGAGHANLMTHAVREEVLLSLVRNSMDAIVSADGVIDYWNPAAEKLYGYTAAEAIGQPATLIGKLHEFEDMKQKLERGERIEQFATQRTKKDGTLVDVEMTVFAVIDRFGKLAATSVMGRDITEQLKLRKEVDQTTKVKTDFLATMSHEIRTPLNAIIGTAELQMLSDLTPEQRRRNGIIESSGELLLTIVDDILDFSKLSAGKLVLEELEFNFVDLIQCVIDTFAMTVRSKELELAFYLDPYISTQLRGDSNRLRQILNNLLSNAIKFTASGEVFLRTTRIKETAEDVTIGFEVRDTGIGIPTEVQKSLFQPFVQADQSTSRRFGGTGLGLVISAQLVEQMGGIIELDSEPGKGSNFHFKLRFEKSERLDPLIRTVPTRVDFAGIRALVVGDGTNSREVISQYLTSWGIENLSIANEESALSEIRSASKNLSVDVVLLDQTPANKGFDLAQIMKRDALLKNIKVIIMSSDPRASMSNYIVEHWLMKPVRPSQLFNCLHQLFSNDHGKGAGVATSAKVVNAQHSSRKDVRVLVVEDNLTNQALIKEQLRVLGYPNRIVDNASQATEILARERYDVVLMDCELPGMDGYQATAKIRRHESDGKQLKIIALTAHVGDDQRQRCLDAGMNGYLSKPVKLQKLAETLDAYSDRPSTGPTNTLSERIEKTEGALDPEALAEIALLSEATRRNVFRDLVDTFVSDLSARIKLISVAIESNNMSQLVSVMHLLKSASAIVGAKYFSDICAKVEEYAHDDEVDQARSLVRKLLEAAQELPTVLFGAPSYKESR